MSKHLDNLARSHGIQIQYTSQIGETVDISDEAKRALLKVLRVDPDDDQLGSFKDKAPDAPLSCALPSQVLGKRLWGVTCQLYALRSSRNLGIGDFEDLARLAELVGGVGADFLGVNPLHALFLSDPERTSPYSPSTRRYLNPLYIAVDRIEGGDEAQQRLRKTHPKLFEMLGGELVDYAASNVVKVKLLRQLFKSLAPSLSGEFEKFCQEGGDGLRSFALFEAISEHEVAFGGGAGWNRWPGDMQQRDSDAVKRFEDEHEEDVRFHLWLQFVAETQLAQAQARAKQAGMQVGLYLDFAVGVAPDGAETWADPELAVRDARVGSPPDLLNSEGQDWGLAPLAPQVLASRGFKPLADAYVALMKNAGAVRIDHAMGLARLWWVPASGKPKQGGFIRYPFGAMLDTVAKASQQTNTVVIGEDLGTVPKGFREVTKKARIFSYRVLYFEKDEDGAFIPPEAYPELALATISTHDLATLAGWWKAADIHLRAETGRQSEKDTKAALEERTQDRMALLQALGRAGLLDEQYAAVVSGGQELPQELGEVLFRAIHRYAARSSSALFAVQLDDMLMSQTQANLPGTTTEYPNWRIRTGCSLEELGANPAFISLAEVLREERPRA
ncbi:4-alpha-glucanotransferase [Devosia submarina]|uniref:4-alpha-glucanotransferase n=1 Tax=Devosia submarina TaxID=1173082 RepID=UPI000D347346|nr:4-alpha-glucanotransferase [Devosia submarina]